VVVLVGGDDGPDDVDAALLEAAERHQLRVGVFHLWDLDLLEINEFGLGSVGLSQGILKGGSIIIDLQIVFGS
jgi:hypothetical protein